MKKIAYLLFAALIMIAQISCDSKTEEKKESVDDKDKELKEDVKIIADINCEIEGLTNDIYAFYDKHGESDNALYIFDELGVMFENCTYITPEEIEALIQQNRKVYLEKRGTGTIVERITDKKGNIEYIIKEDQNKITGRLKADTISSELMAEMTTFVEKFCQKKELLNQSAKIYEEMNNKYKNENVSEKSQKILFDFMTKCPNFSPERLEEIKKEMNL
ncbi:MAG: hypothetical protein A2W91_02465 [Bacteroidetes bacterium GWF2_38_335]|nr:MAG: hypothetical protein A2W91_02465 [Bacteroidetes bacterium GWF2_38_335]OFY80711.1 MAG: hypothetical protein A2281_05480 [Bacteroidetes bacterium RIFOXYA12_FULL_38_20]HBS87059.1 hypothetical protein [Bacteroidales bacterium]